MTLGQFAVAVGASPRWVLNAMARLGLRRSYTEPLARRMALCRFISEAAHTPLLDALRLADRVLREAEPASTWRLEGKAGVSLVVDLPRFFTAYGANLALALNAYGEKPRGRRASRRGSAIERARAYGIDVSLLDSALRRTPEERGRRVAEDMAFLSEIRGKLR